MRQVPDDQDVSCFGGSGLPQTAFMVVPPAAATPEQPAGLVELFEGGRRHLTPWSMVRGVRWLDQGALLDLTDRLLLLDDRRCPDWQALARLVEHLRQAPQPSPAAAAAREEELAARRALGPGLDRGVEQFRWRGWWSSIESAWVVPPGEGTSRLPEGLTFVCRSGRRLHLPWEEVAATDGPADHILARRLIQELPLERQCRDRRRLSRRIDEWATAVREGSDAADAAAREQAEALRAALAEPVAGEAWAPRDMLLAFGATGATLAFFLLLGSRQVRPTTLVAIAGCGALVLGLLAALAPFVRADAEGVTVRQRGRRRWYAWSEIEGVQVRGTRCRVATARGGFTLPITSEAARQFERRVTQVVTARLSHVPLPGGAPVPGAALSRLTGEAEPADRALSVSRPADGA